MNKQLDDGGPAFPVDTNGYDLATGGGYGHQTRNMTWQFPGMTLRDYFAGQVCGTLMAPLLNIETAGAIREVVKAAGKTRIQYVADASYQLADAMLAARALPQGAPK